MNIQGKVILKKGREASARRFHPWIFSGAIHALEGNPADGDWVEVQDAGKHTLGYGHYQKGTITIRLLSFLNPPGESFYREKINKALNQRVVSKVISDFTNCFRLVHGEGDGLPGLIIDVYNGVAIMQAHSVGVHKDREAIAEAIKEVVKGVHSIYYKS